MGDYADRGHWGLDDIRTPTPTEYERVRLLICANAHNTADAQLLLDAVGLL